MTVLTSTRVVTQEQQGTREAGTLFMQLYCLMIALAFGLSAVIFFGGDVRFSGPTFAGPRDLVEWAGVNPRMAWGALFLAISIGLIVAMRRPWALHVLRFGLVVYCFLVVTFVKSAVAYPTAVLTGIVAYAIFAGAHLLLAAYLEKYGWR